MSANAGTGKDVRVVYETATGRILTCTSGESFPLAPGQAELRVPKMVLPDAWRVSGGRLVEAPPPAPPPFDVAQALALRAIDADAERARLRWITPGAGQAAVYLAKREEALRMAADPNPAPKEADYPLLASEVGVTAPDLAAVGQSVWATSEAWLRVAARIEGLRLSAKRAVERATTRDQLAAAVIVAWPSPGDSAGEGA